MAAEPRQDEPLDPVGQGENPPNEDSDSDFEWIELEAPPPDNWFVRRADSLVADIGCFLYVLMHTLVLLRVLVDLPSLLRVISQLLLPILHLILPLIDLPLLLAVMAMAIPCAIWAHRRAGGRFIVLLSLLVMVTGACSAVVPNNTNFRAPWTNDLWNQPQYTTQPYHIELLSSPSTSSPPTSSTTTW